MDVQKQGRDLLVDVKNRVNGMKRGRNLTVWVASGPTLSLNDGSLLNS